ncbi:hypothetical protein EI168_10445 [Halomonas sp. FME1]|uniref:HdeA/HdeB family protein n=1 Tax=Halomonas casei TaxID=2742613 RepID=A0ABR9F212_9GAMM|nr:hypothetical protein [Halomonas casei]MBE0400523.1 hypothetical protein [Halomonas casei]
MKTKLAIAALSIALSAPAMADNDPSQYTMCERVGIEAEHIMYLRQMGTSFDEAYDANEKFSSITIRSRYEPIVGIDLVEAFSKSFGESMQKSCESGEMFWTTDGYVMFH